MLPVLISEICLLIILVIMWFLSILSDKKQAQTLFQNILMMFLSASTTFLWVNNNHCPLCLSLQFVFTLLKIPNINGDKGTAEHSQFWWYSVTKLLLNFSSSAVTLHSSATHSHVQYSPFCVAAVRFEAAAVGWVPCSGTAQSELTEVRVWGVTCKTKWIPSQLVCLNDETMCVFVLLSSSGAAGSGLRTRLWCWLGLAERRRKVRWRRQERQDVHQLQLHIHHLLHRGTGGGKHTQTHTADAQKDSCIVDIGFTIWWWGDTSLTTTPTP